MTGERQLAAFIRDVQLADVPTSTVTTVRRMLLAGSSGGIAGAGEDGIDIVRDVLCTRGGRAEATSLVFGDRLPATSAALLNGTMCRALDFCEAMAPGVHVGSSVFPAALAAAESIGGLSGREFLTALVVGAEVGARFNLTEQMYDGFDPTGIASVFGATAAAGRILSLTETEMVNALGLAFNRCGGSFQSNIDGSLAVRLQQGLAAEAAVLSAQLAKQGFTGPENFLEGTYGFIHLYAKGLCGPERFVEALGHSWKLDGFMFKKYPSCGVTQGVTSQALSVVAEMALTPADVREVEVRMPPYSHRLVGNPFVIGANPRVNAQFSVQYCVANAIVRGASKLRHFRPEAVVDAGLRPIIDRVRVIADASMDERGHSSVDLALVTTDGRVAHRSVDIAPGYPGNGLSDSEHRERFDDCIDYAPFPMSPSQSEGWLRSVDSLEDIDDVRTLLQLLVTV